VDELTRFVNLREKDLRREGLFVAEGKLLVERSLISGYEVLGIVSDKASSDAAFMSAGSTIPVYVCTSEEIDRLAGFSFHRGMLALVRRPEQKNFTFSDINGSPRVLVLPSITDPGNLGALLRSALAFGFETVLLGNKTCDPFNRKALRSSMGAALVLNLYMAEPDSIKGFLDCDYRVLAAEMKEDALVSVAQIPGYSHLALVLGNEYEGIPADWRKYCSDSMMIKVSSAVDSLNVAVAGSILMWELSKQLLP